MLLLVIHTLLVIQSVWWCCSSSCSGPEMCSVIRSAQGFCSALIPKPTSDLSESWSLGVSQRNCLAFRSSPAWQRRGRERETLRLLNSAGEKVHFHRFVGSSGHRVEGQSDPMFWARMVFREASD